MITEEMKNIFANIFIVENRLTNACEKIQEDITMKQWLLLAIVMSEGENYNLTELGAIMGCSRQNIKKLVSALEGKEYIEIVKGSGRSQLINVLPKTYELAARMEERYCRTLEILFSHFDQEGMINFQDNMKKFLKGLEEVENYAETLD